MSQRSLKGCCLTFHRKLWQQQSLGVRLMVGRVQGVRQHTRHDRQAAVLWGLTLSFTACMLVHRSCAGILMVGTHRATGCYGVQL